MFIATIYRFGPVAKIVTFNKNSEFQGFVQYVDQLSAMAALNVSFNLFNRTTQQLNINSVLTSMFTVVAALDFVFTPTFFQSLTNHCPANPGKKFQSD